ncbi:DUF2498 family protein [Escherichia coli]
MNKETQPIDRETLLKEANKIIREHEDTLAGIEAPASRSVMACWSYRRLLLDEQGLPTAKSAAVFNMFKHHRPMCFQKNIIWLIKAKREVLASRCLYINGF